MGVLNHPTLLQSQVELKELQVPQEQNLEDAPSRSCGSWRCVELDEGFEGQRVPKKSKG